MAGAIKGLLQDLGLQKKPKRRPKKQDWVEALLEPKKRQRR